jgi:DNA mismatch repair protein MutS
MTASEQTEPKVSPMMGQWHACKKTARDAVLFFRMGDFYEAFYEDAALIAKELDLTLTKRQEIPMSGVPCHTCETYIDKLVAKGYRVAVAEQMEDPKQTKGIVRREVVRVVSPGTLMSSSLLSDKSNNYFACIARVGAFYGLAVLDLTTSEFRVIEFDNEPELMNEIYRLRPAEILTSNKFKEKHHHLFDDISKSFACLINTEEDWRFDHQIALDFISGHFKTLNLDGFGLRGMVAAINAAGALLRYIQEILNLSITHITEVLPYSLSQYMSLDRTSQRNLELAESFNGGRSHTLLSILDNTKTPMGARMLKHWIKQPLLDPAEIAKRQDAIQTFLEYRQSLDRLSQQLDEVRDLQRLMTKINSGYATPRDLAALKASLYPIPHIKQLLQALKEKSFLLSDLDGHLHPCTELTHLIANALVEDPPLRLNEGKIFRDGYHPELDELREISRDSKSWIARYQVDLRESTGIRTLKVGFTRMFGYYIEVSKGQSDSVPDYFIRRQTLVNGERFITPELKDYESKVLNAEDKIIGIENELFSALRQEASKYSTLVLETAQALAQIDALQSLAIAARQHDYCRPLVDDSLLIDIQEGRHPVIEAINSGDRFIPNDTSLNNAKERLMLITGPNMAGKSTYIRQVALITIMAQMGSFVPAKSAHIGVVDKVFTRIGASDDLSRGQSTFMVEMTETANILHNATARSLVILDEIGRGTSTYDGISIAWAVAEYLLTAEDKTAKTLFATHYWELTKLEEKVPGAVNYNVAVHEGQDGIVFLRKIIKGGTDRSYGIHVARLAGLPGEVLQRASEILVHLEENANRKSAFEPSQPKKIPSKRKTVPSNMQLTFFS